VIILSSIIAKKWGSVNWIVPVASPAATIVDWVAQTIYRFLLKAQTFSFGAIL
jgi:hypothetical protein